MVDFISFEGYKLGQIFDVVIYGSAKYSPKPNDIDIALIADNIELNFRVFGIRLAKPIGFFTERIGIYHLLYVSKIGLKQKFKDNRKIQDALYGSSNGGTNKVGFAKLSSG